MTLVTSNPAQTGSVTAMATRNFSEFCTAVSESFVPLQVTRERPNAFQGSIRSTTVDKVHVYEVNADAHVVERTPQLIARGDRHYFKLSVQLEGSGLLIQDNREAVLHAGDLAVYDTNRPYSLVFDKHFRTMVVMFPKHFIDLPAPVVGDITAVAMSGTDGVGRLVSPFLSQMVGNLEQLSNPTGTRIVHNALDLLTTMFTSILDVERATGQHTVLRQRIRGYIETNLASTELNPSHIAAAHFISTRHLHNIFHEEETTVSAWIRTRRLEHCRRDLLNPVLLDRPVAAIAARWGFLDAAHFSRVFKSHYGHAPSELRNNAL